MSTSWTIRTFDKNHCIATWDRVLIQVWYLDTTSLAVANLGKIARAFVAETKHPVSSIAIVERTSPGPAESVRAELSEFYKSMSPQLKEAIVVAEGGGFHGALVRGVGITLSMLAPKALPFKFVSSVNEATAIIAPHLSPVAGGALGFQRTIDGLRAEIGKTLSR